MIQSWGTNGGSDNDNIENADGTFGLEEGVGARFSKVPEGSDEEGDTNKGILNSRRGGDSFGGAMSPSCERSQHGGKWSSQREFECSFDMSDSALVDASMFGGDTSFGFTGGNTNTASTKAEEDNTTPTDDGADDATDLHHVFRWWLFNAILLEYFEQHRQLRRIVHV